MRRPTIGASAARGAAWLRNSSPVLLAGAAVAVTAVELTDPGRVSRSAAIAAGALYALVLRFLVRAFPVRPALRPLAGLVVGALPFALLFARTLPRDERIALGVGLALAGGLIGAFERADEPPSRG